MAAEDEIRRCSRAKLRDVCLRRLILITGREVHVRGIGAGDLLDRETDARVRMHVGVVAREDHGRHVQAAHVLQIDDARNRVCRVDVRQDGGLIGEEGLGVGDVQSTVASRDQPFDSAKWRLAVACSC